MGPGEMAERRGMLLTRIGGGEERQRMRQHSAGQCRFRRNRIGIPEKQGLQGPFAFRSVFYAHRLSGILDPLAGGTGYSAAAIRNDAPRL